MKIHLLPCPFCGKKVEAPVQHFQNKESWSLIHRCKVLGPIQIENALEGIQKIWNTRKADPTTRPQVHPDESQRDLGNTCVKSVPVV